MKLLFVFGHPGQSRYYETAIKLFLKRGYKVHLAFNNIVESRRNLHMDDAVGKLAPDNNNFSYGLSPGHRDDHWRVLARLIRLCGDYLFYFKEIFDNSPQLRLRVKSYLPKFLYYTLPPLFEKLILVNKKRTFIRIFKKIYDLFEESIPPNKTINNYIDYIDPDIILITPLVYFASDQTDYIKSSRALGKKIVLCVLSWDNLTCKGPIRVKPNKVILWNNTQKNEACNIHGIKSNDIIITGAQVFDEWFVRKPSSSRKSFIQKVGLEKNNPYILYLGSASTITPSEVERKFVKDWIEKIRNYNDLKFKETGILIRPHPTNIDQWKKDFVGKNITIWPKHGSTTESEKGKEDFYDSVFHSSAVFGINTTSLIEAGIINRPIHSILIPEFKNSQQGTIHFNYLKKGGLLITGKNFKEHLDQLKMSIYGNDNINKDQNNFIKYFIRPNGINKSSSSMFVDSVDSLISKKIKKINKPILSYTISIFLSPIAYLLFIVKFFFIKEEPGYSLS